MFQRTLPQLGSFGKRKDESNPFPSAQLHCFNTKLEPSASAQLGYPWEAVANGVGQSANSNGHTGWSSSHDRAHLQTSQTRVRSQPCASQRSAPKAFKRLLWPSKHTTPASELASTTHSGPLSTKSRQEQCTHSTNGLPQRVQSSHRPPPRPVRSRRSSSVALPKRKLYQATVNPCKQQTVPLIYPDCEVSLAFGPSEQETSVAGIDRHEPRSESWADQHISSLPVTWAANYTANEPDVQSADAQRPVKVEMYPTPGPSPSHDDYLHWDQDAYWQREQSVDIQLPERRYFPLTVTLQSPTPKPANPPTFQRLIRGIRSARSIKSLKKLSQSALRSKTTPTDTVSPPSPDYDTWPLAPISPHFVPAHSVADGLSFPHSDPMCQSSSIDSMSEHFLPYSSYGFDGDQCNTALAPLAYREVPPPLLPTPPPSSPSSSSIASIDSVVLPPRTSSLPNFVLRPHRLASHTPIRSTLPKLKLKPAPKSRQSSVFAHSTKKTKKSPHPAKGVEQGAQKYLIDTIPEMAHLSPTNAVSCLYQLSWSPPRSRSVTLTHITISGQDLTDMSSLEGCQLATHLCLARNRLRRLPACIADFQQLTHLNLSHNRLHHLTAQLGNLVQLVDLNLAHNLLTQIPVTIGHLVHLRSLSLSGNPLTKLPHSMAALFPTLKSFHIGSWPAQGLVIDRCQFESVPDHSLTHTALCRQPANAACSTQQQPPSNYGQFVRLERQILRRMMSLLVSQLDRVEHQTVAIPWPSHSYGTPMLNAAVASCNTAPTMAQPALLSSTPVHPAHVAPGVGADDYQRLFATFKVYENVLRRASRNAPCAAS
ncbi:hypothetical protein H4R34_001929 [Dimargaris verticillata]|uniref:Uncharacterized protein n=1 Tax=Dimargaris verticillata TaxID=2761393 RepID=A0A9W8B8Z5_9FUNG|nr:hypothetical protein H4R34_001929 [Dimargaris verticillata]